ncbi:MAG: tetratricopeptide repeat protein, partial [Anaerolineae bacterium]|nr:tetratricopeptide repeat protein [Anaerolineae bacterium]
MPGNRELYERAMNMGYNAAWDKDWSQAIAAYGQAIQEFPDDHEAHISLGLALLEVGRLDDALRVYTRAHQINPTDPIPLEKSADVLEKVGRLKEAAQQYINVAEIYLSQRDLDKAIFNWQQATRLTPGMVAIHAKLAQAYERLGQKAKSIREYLVLAQNFQRLGESDKALRAAQRALKLDPKNVTTLNALRAIESGSDMSLPAAEKDPNARTNDSNTSTTKLPIVAEADPLGPIGETMTYAMAMLATFVMEGGALDASGGDALQALELQRQAINDQAIQAYQRAEARMNHPALKMNLGGLLVLTNRNEEAIKHLGEAAMHPQLAPGAFHALGKAYFAMNKHKQAINYLLQAAQAVDSAHAMSSETDMQIADSYEHLLEVLQNRPAETLTAINKRFNDLLTGKEWKQRIGETRRQLEDTLRNQGEQGVVDILVATRSNE